MEKIEKEEKQSTSSAMSPPHVLMVPLPESGHIKPLMQLATYLASNGVLVSFVNTEYNHNRIISSNKSNLPSDRGLTINLVSVPDSLSEEENKDTDITNFFKALENKQDALCSLISKLNAEGPPITCIISDACVGSTMEVAKRFGIPRAAFWCPSASTFAMVCHAISESQSGSFPAKGVFEKEEIVKFARLPTLPSCRLPWILGAKQHSEWFFEYNKHFIEILGQSEWILSNSVQEIELTALQDMPIGFPKLSTIGPVLPSSLMQKYKSKDSDHLQSVTIGLWSEDCSCIEWLDKQNPNSVLYVSVGSIAIVNRDQLLELAYGLEASGIPILWVVRSDIMDKHGLPEEFMERTNDRIKLVTWAPQLQVLAHDAVGGFLTHNGWNSTIEALSVGVPMLAWPQLVDQFMNAELVVKQWGVGLEFDIKHMGLVRREIVADRVTMLMKGEEGRNARSNALRMMDVILKAYNAGGSSYTHLNQFLKWVIKLQSESTSKGIEPIPTKYAVEQNQDVNQMINNGGMTIA